MNRLLILGAAALLMSTAPAEAGVWKVENRTSELDGARTVVATVDSDTQSPNSIGRPEAATLIVRCLDRQLETYIAWPGFIGIDNVDGLYRVGDGAVHPARLSISTDGTATFFTGRAQGDFLTALRGDGRLVVRITPRRYGQQEAAWELTGTAAALDQARAACPG